MSEEKKKGMICSILEDKRLGNCSNGGISSKHKKVLLWSECKELQIFEESKDCPAVEIKTKNAYGEEYVYVQPVGNPTGRGWMMGGSFIHSCDSRFREVFGNKPIPLHDRQETPEQSEMMSR